MKEFLKKVSWVAIANATAMVVSALITIVLPKFVTIREYGYWQMYLLFVTYIGCIHLGLPDGIYLRYSGKEYKDVVRNEIKVLFWISTIYEIVVSVLVYAIALKSTVCNLAICFAVCTCVYVPSLYLKYIILASNMMKQYSLYVLSEKVVMLIAICMSALGCSVITSNFIYVDIIAKTIALVYALAICRDCFVFRIQRLSDIWKEYKLNIAAGICLMISTVSSNFIVGVIRIFIDIKWTIEDFGKVSLALQISNFVLVFVRAISLPLFPVVKRQESNNVVLIYEKLRLVLITIIMSVIVMYFPLAIFLRGWLPEYSESITYLGILFPICLFEAKQALLCETYLKSFRKERFLLLVNVGTMLLSVLISYFIIFAFENQRMSIYFILFILCFRSTVSELYLNRFLRRKIRGELVCEIVLVFIFVVGNGIFEPLVGLGIYVVSLLIYMWMHRKEYKDIKEMLIEKEL